MRVNIEYYDGRVDEFTDVNMIFKQDHRVDVIGGDIQLIPGEFLKINLSSDMKIVPMSEIEQLSIDQVDKKEELVQLQKDTNIAGISARVFKDALNGFYYKAKDGNIYWSGNNWIFVGNSFSGYFIETKCPNGDDSHIFDWSKSEYVKLSDYGKTWGFNEDGLK